MSSLPLSKEAMRRKRLAALGFKNEGDGGAAGDDDGECQNHNNANAANNKTNHDGKGRVEKKKNQKDEQKEVVDLLWMDSTDDEDDDKPPVPPPAKKQKKNKKDINKFAGTITNNPYAKKKNNTKKAPPPPAGSTISSSVVAAASSRSATTSSPTLQFQAGTYNVWFGPCNAPNPHVGPRMRALARLLRQQDGRTMVDNDRSDNNSEKTPPYYPLWFVGLQEVTHESLPHLVQGLQAGGLTQFVQQDNAAPYFCVLAAKKELTILDSGWNNYSTTVMGRGFCFARVRIPFSDRQLLIATTHLESYTGKHFTGANERRLQLLEWKRYCQQQMQRHDKLHSCIFIGDLNWDDESRSPKDERVSSVLEGCPHQDAWLQYVEHKNLPKADRAGYTYDCKLNPMLGGNIRKRFDRCIVFPRTTSSSSHHGMNNNNNNNVQCHSVELLGKEVLPGLFFDKTSQWGTKNYPAAPSDHFGLCCKLEL